MRIEDNNALPGDFLYIHPSASHQFYVIQKHFDNTLDIKDSLEEKSRAILFSITVSITLILGLLTIILGQSFATFNVLSKFFIMIFGLLSLICMVIGVILTVDVLSEKNRVYQLSPDDDNRVDDIEKRKKLALYVEQNTNMNIIRSNTVFASYTVIRTSIVLLCFLFLSLCVASLLDNNMSTKKDTDISKITDQIKNTRDSLESIFKRIELINKDRESEKMQLISIFSKSIEGIDKIGKELEELRKKNVKDQLGSVAVPTRRPTVRPPR
jgi:hypothetical protein